MDFNSNIAYIFLRFRFETETSHNNPNEEGHKPQKNEHVIEESGNWGRHKDYKLDSETNLVINVAFKKSGKLYSRPGNFFSRGVQRS